jgi:hypothetical protein
VRENPESARESPAASVVYEFFEVSPERASDNSKDRSDGRGCIGGAEKLAGRSTDQEVGFGEQAHCPIYRTRSDRRLARSVGLFGPVGPDGSIDLHPAISRVRAKAFTAPTTASAQTSERLLTKSVSRVVQVSANLREEVSGGRARTIAPEPLVRPHAPAKHALAAFHRVVAMISGGSLEWVDTKRVCPSRRNREN